MLYLLLQKVFKIFNILKKYNFIFEIMNDLSKAIHFYIIINW
jgi:hypothetical protein